MREKNNTLCSVPGCGEKFYARGYCRRHYAQYRVYKTTALGDKRSRVIHKNLKESKPLESCNCVDAKLTYICPETNIEIVIDINDLDIQLGALWKMTFNKNFAYLPGQVRISYVCPSCLKVHNFLNITEGVSVFEEIKGNIFKRCYETANLEESAICDE